MLYFVNFWLVFRLLLVSEDYRLCEFLLELCVVCEIILYYILLKLVWEDRQLYISEIDL